MQKSRNLLFEAGTHGINNHRKNAVPLQLHHRKNVSLRNTAAIFNANEHIILLNKIF